MRLEYRHNNAYDTVVLVSHEGEVQSEWTVTPDMMHEFCDCSQDPTEWDDQGGDFAAPKEYGDLVAVREGHTLRAINVSLWEAAIMRHAAK